MNKESWYARSISDVDVVTISYTDDWSVDYDKSRGMYRVSYFEDNHFVDEHWFDAYEDNEKKDVIECEIPLGRLCCFKPLDKDTIFFGHMAGKVIDDFENMTFMYVLMCDNRYFFSRKVIIKPNDVHTSNDAKRYF